MLRQTITIRDRALYTFLLRRSRAEAEARFGSASYKEYRARVVLAEMLVEYARRDSAEHFFQIERTAIAQLRPGSSFLLSALRFP